VVASSSTSRQSVPTWAPPLSLTVCVLGLLDAGYLTYEHFTASTTLACSDTGAINCLKVTTSSYAVVLGIPVAALGLLFFIGMTAVCLPALWRRGGRPVRLLRLGGASVGMLTVLYLIWVELFQVNAICLWCTGVHVLTFILFVVVVLASTVADSDADPDASLDPGKAAADQAPG
jgi:uncharacterized membrane protein